MLGYKTPLENNLVLQSKDDIISKYYIRICVKDRAGVLAKVSSVLGNRDISIEAMIQKPTKKEDCANLLFITHLARELDIQNAIKELEALEFVATKIVMVRVDS
jgi:homoserine dehydrogenase